MKLLTFLLFSSLAFSQNIKVSEQFVRLLPASAPNTGGFLTLENTSKKDIKLLKAKANISKMVELHTLIKDGDTMMMREVDSILVPAGKRTELKPGGLHIMFMGLKKPLKEKEIVEIELEFDNGDKQTVKFPILNK